MSSLSDSSSLRRSAAVGTDSDAPAADDNTEIEDDHENRLSLVGVTLSSASCRLAVELQKSTRIKSPDERVRQPFEQRSPSSSSEIFWTPRVGHLYTGRRGRHRSPPY